MELKMRAAAAVPLATSSSCHSWQDIRPSERPNGKKRLWWINYSGDKSLAVLSDTQGLMGRTVFERCSFHWQQNFCCVCEMKFSMEVARSDLSRFFSPYDQIFSGAAPNPTRCWNSGISF